MSASRLQFFIPCVPPNCTSQGKGISARGGRVWTFKKSAQLEAEQFFRTVLTPHRPEVPISGPVSLDVEIRWPYPKAARRRSDGGSWKTTKPDSVNWVKGFEDVMTQLGFWQDDAQVCLTLIARKWHDTPGICVTVEALE